jgi:hypothetical protein
VCLTYISLAKNKNSGLEFALKSSRACEMVESPQRLITAKEEILAYFLVVKIVTYTI